MGMVLLDKGPVFSAQTDLDKPEVLDFIDIVPTSLLCWLIDHQYLTGSQVDFVRLQANEIFGVHQIRECFAQSVFAKLACEFTRERFVAYMEREHQNRIRDVSEVRVSKPKGFVGSEQDFKAWRLKITQESRQEFLTEIAIMSKLRDYVFGATLESKEHYEVWGQIVRVARLFPLYMDELIHTLWKETQA
jgi:hypothetical protein